MSKLARIIVCTLMIFTISCSKESKALKHAQKARELSSKHEYSTAIQEYNSAREILPESQEYKNELANVYYGIGKDNFKIALDAFNSGQKDIESLSNNFELSITNLNLMNDTLGQDIAFKNKLNKLNQDFSDYINYGKGKVELEKELETNNDKYKSLTADGKLKEISFLPYRRFDTTSSGKGIYEAYNNNSYKKAVLISDEDMVKTGTYNTFYVEYKGEQKYSVTQSNAFQNFETNEYYETYEVLKGENNPQYFLKKIRDIKYELDKIYKPEAVEKASLVLISLEGIFQKANDFNNFIANINLLPNDLKPKETPSSYNTDSSSSNYASSQIQNNPEIPTTTTTPEAIAPQTIKVEDKALAVDNCVTTTDEQKKIECKYDTFVSLEKDINNVWDNLIKSLSKGQKKELTKEELKWISYKDNSCNIGKGKYPPKDFKKLECLEKITNERIEILKGYKENGYKLASSNNQEYTEKQPIVISTQKNIVHTLTKPKTFENKNTNGRKISQAQEAEILKLYHEGKSVRDISKKLLISRSTVSEVIK